MRPEERDRELILNIIEDAEVLKKRIQYFGMTEQGFVEDDSFEGTIAYDALLIPVYTIVEDALHLSDQVMGAFPDYPWHEVRAFRNIVAHGYRRVSRKMAWQVVSQDVPILVGLLRQYAADKGYGEPAYP